MAKRSRTDLVRLALHYAIQDRESMADACGLDADAGQRAAAMAQEFKDYLITRFGERTADEDFERRWRESGSEVVRVFPAEDLKNR